jgi:tetratricopeptide (TPR) repeat protein
LKAYDVWLLGQATFLSFNARRWEKARDLFRQVIAQASDFAPAYSTLAQLNNTQHIAMPGIFRDSSRTAEALAYAREAARLDPLDSRSQLCLGWSHAMLRQFDQAIIFMRLACELNQNDPWTQVSSAVCLSLCGEYEQAQEIAEHILELPLAPSPMQWQYHACIRFLCSDYRGCVEATVASGYFGYAPGFSASALSHLGDRNAAVDELRRFFELVRGGWVGDEPPSEANITRWFLYIAPTKRPEDWQRLRDGLAAAGAPVEGLSYDKL